MDQTPPQGGAPQGEQPSQPQQPQMPQQPQQPPPQQPGGYAPPEGGYAPPPQGYTPPPQGAPPPGYQPQGYPPPGGMPPQQGYPPPGYAPQGPPQGYPPQGYGPPPPAQKRGGMPVWAWVVIGIVVVLIIGCVGSFVAFTYVATKTVSSLDTTFSQIGSGLQSGALGSFEPIGVASEFYINLEVKDYESARQQLGPSLASKYSADDLKARWEALESAQGTVTASFPTGDLDSGGTTATLTQHLDTEKGKTYSIKLKMEKLEGEWKITSADPDLIPAP